MSITAVLVFSVLALAVSSLVLASVLRLDVKGKMEYAFYLREYVAKTGKRPTWRQKLAAYSGALGGPSPKWHWIRPVLAPSESAYGAD